MYQWTIDAMSIRMLRRPLARITASMTKWRQIWFNYLFNNNSSFKILKMVFTFKNLALIKTINIMPIFDIYIVIE